jgi:peptidoglycan/xylan/chitin deacetylase (PgdA/CDA1 family)
VAGQGKAESPSWCSRKAALLGLAILAMVSLGLLEAPAATQAAGSGPVLVSLTFDDGWQDQYAVRELLSAHRMRGTFYVNSGAVDASTPDFMSWSQLQDLAADGNEIAGHTLTHPHLLGLTPQEQQREICDDRSNLLDHGFSPVISFAYPYAEHDAALRAVVRSCGYLSARSVHGVRSLGCSACPAAETIPPRAPWALRTPRHITSDTTLAQMQGYVTQAERGGRGWVVLVFHRLCDQCDELSTPLNRFAAFLDWLQLRASRGTVVKTVGSVITGDFTPPVTSIKCNRAKCPARPTKASRVRVSLAAKDERSAVAWVRYTTNGTIPTRVKGRIYTAPFTVTKTTTVLFRSADGAGNLERVRAQRVRFETGRR